MLGSREIDAMVPFLAVIAGCRFVRLRTTVLVTLVANAAGVTRRVTKKTVERFFSLLGKVLVMTKK